MNPDSIQAWPDPTATSLARSRLLCNVTGTTPESLLAKANEVVSRGVARALASVPKASYGNYVTVDRDEIERTNEVRRLILEYQRSPKDKRPLSIAVFGAPGTGKSFTIKEIGKVVLVDGKSPLEFNLTQMRSSDELHRALHQVRDASIRREIPLVFWDEFDTGGLRWIAEFLAPMQDADFFEGGLKHPIGKCIFVFAGGTSSSFDEFKAWRRPDDLAELPADEIWSESFKAVKGPDFVSRLRGFVDVKGPNPVCRHMKMSHEEAVTDDPAYVLRRALILRSEFERNFPNLIAPGTKELRIATNVLRALLSVNRYEHGSRSLSAMVAMSELSGSKAFNMSALPSRQSWSLHVSEDFHTRLNETGWPNKLQTDLAKAVHEEYRRKLRASKKKHPDLVKWEKLNPRQLLDNLDPVPHRLLALLRLGYSVVPLGAESAIAKSPGIELDVIVDQMIEPEHRIWLSRRLVEGWEYAAHTCRHLRQNSNVLPFNRLEQEQQELNRAIVRVTLNALEDAGYKLVRTHQGSSLSSV
jgi:hypothetical protein